MRDACPRGEVELRHPALRSRARRGRAGPRPGGGARQARAAFDAFDRNKRGYVTLRDVVHGFARVAPGVPGASSPTSFARLTPTATGGSHLGITQASRDWDRRWTNGRVTTTRRRARETRHVRLARTSRVIMNGIILVTSTLNASVISAERVSGGISARFPPSATRRTYPAGAANRRQRVRR